MCQNVIHPCKVFIFRRERYLSNQSKLYNFTLKVACFLKLKKIYAVLEIA